jgi:zinc transporter ZupT
MILGLLIAAIVLGAAASVVLFAMSSPLWVVLIAYPLTGTCVMLFGMVAISLCNRTKSAAVLAQPHFPVQRNTTPTVATSTLTSVTNDNSRS